MTEQSVPEQSFAAQSLTEHTVPAQVPPPSPHPVAPPGNPADMWAVPAQLIRAPRRRRPWVRTSLRWGTAVLLCLTVGCVTALAVTVPPRTDLPGLGTPADGRYVFPALKLPPLAPGVPAPADPGTGGDDAAPHPVDLRQLLLPAPVGARPVAGYPGTRGWYPVSSMATVFSPVPLASWNELGLRHIAATAWTAPDGSRAEIYLLAYRSSEAATSEYYHDIGTLRLKAAPGLDEFEVTSLPDMASAIGALGSAPAVPGKAPAARAAIIANGEVEALVVMTNPRIVSSTTFRQVVTLQDELLRG